MSHIFISYARKDFDFAGRIVQALAKNKLDTWADWKNIPPSVGWEDEIYRGIEGADAFLFLISPDSVRSRMCNAEISHAVRNGKRIVTLLIRDTDPASIPLDVSKIQWIQCRDGQDDFIKAIEETHKTIHTDYEWLKYHTSLQVKALEWERNNHEKSFLLHGKELQDAEFQLATNSSKEPYPTDLQREYVLVSRQATDRQRRITTTIAVVGVMALAVLAMYGFVQAGRATNQATIAQTAQSNAESNASMAQTAEANALSEANGRATAQANAEENQKLAEGREKIARAGELAVQSVSFRNSQLDRSLLLSIEAFRAADIPRTRSVLLDNTQIDPNSVPSLRGHNGMVWTVAFSPDGSTLASGSCGKIDDNFGCLQGEVLLWDLETRQPLGQVFTVSDEVFSVTFSPDSSTLASGSEDGIVMVWDIVTHQLVGQPLMGHTRYVTSLSFHPDGKMLASASGDRTIILWDVATQQPIGRPLTGHVYAVTSVVFSPDGKILASGSIDRTIILWNVETRQPIGQPLTGHAAPVYSVAFSPDGSMLASGSADKTIILWDVKTRQLISHLTTGHADWINSLAFSPDGNTLASGSADKTIILWDIAAHQSIGQPLKGHNDWVNSMAFSPNGETLASGSCGVFNDDFNCLKGEILLWDVNTLSWVEKICQRAHRNFTYEEWLQYFPNENYRKTCEQWPNDPSYYRAIAKTILSNYEDPRRVQSALLEVNVQMQRDSSIEDPMSLTYQVVGEAVQAQFSNEERAGKLGSALDLLQQARSLPFEIDYGNLLNDICWDGSLQGHADQVLQYCEQAVALAPDDKDIRDSRGLARALTGDYAGAIDDFQFFIDHADFDENYDSQVRQQWIVDLQSGQNPFTPEVLELLIDS